MNRELRALNDERLYKFSHSRRFSSRVLFNNVDNRTPNHCPLGEFSNGREMPWSGNSKSDRHREPGKTADPLDKRFHISRHLLASTRNTSARYRVNETS